MTNKYRQNDQHNRRVYHLAHCNMRLRQRYGLEMSPEDYDKMCRMFQNGNVVGARDDGNGHTEGWVRFKDTWVCASYKRASGMVGTIMPAPPPLILDAVKSIDPEDFNRKVNEAAKKGALALLESALKAEKKPKWYPPPAPTPPNLDRRDTSWYKTQMKEVQRLLKNSLVVEAAELLDAVASLPGTFSPSQEPEKAEQLIKARIEHERKQKEQRLDLLAASGKGF